jgi:hypothetical protein
MGMQNDCDRRRRRLGGVIAAFKPTFRSVDQDFWHWSGNSAAAGGERVYPMAMVGNSNFDAIFKGGKT